MLGIKVFAPNLHESVPGEKDARAHVQRNWLGDQLFFPSLAKAVARRPRVSQPNRACYLISGMCRALTAPAIGALHGAA